MSQLIEMENKIDKLTKENNFLRKVLKLMCTSNAIDDSVYFKIRKDDPYLRDINFKCDDTTEYLNYENIKKNIHENHHYKIHNYEEYSNLPKNCILCTLDNIVHDGYLLHIYGYLDVETKTFVEYDYNFKE